MIPRSAFTLCHLLMILGAGTFMSYTLSFVVETTLTVIGRIYINPLLERVESLAQKLMTYLSKHYDFCQRLFRPMIIRQLMYPL